MSVSPQGVNKCASSHQCSETEFWWQASAQRQNIFIVVAKKAGFLHKLQVSDVGTDILWPEGTGWELNLAAEN